MPQSKKIAQTYVFSTVGIIAIAALLIGANAIMQVVNLRADCTENNVYTLSEGTKTILNQIQNPVRIEFYCSEKSEAMPVRLKNYAREVENLLQEYKQSSGGAVKIRKKIPEPLSDAADTAQKLGISPRRVSQGNKIYFGLAVTQFDQSKVIPFLSPDKRNRLEYEITSKIDQIIHPEKPTIGVFSSLPIMGSQRRPSPMQRQGSDQEPWWIIKKLREQYEVKKLNAEDLKELSSNVDVLMLVHPPADLSEQAKFGIDQYLLNGGKMMAFIDPMCMSAQEGKQNRLRRRKKGPPQTSSLDPLLNQWGVKYQKNKVIADMIYQTRIGGGRGRASREMPTLLSLTGDAMNQEDPATSPINSIIAAFPGALEGSAPTGVTRDVLMHSSTQSYLANKYEARMGGDAVKKNFTPSEKEFPIAISLRGSFSTAYPDGPPSPSEAKGKEDKQKNGPDKKTDDQQQSFLKESQNDGRVVLVADADMLNDRFCIRQQTIFGKQMSSTISDNLSFVQNKLEQLSGSTSLAKIRSRGAERRPFVVINRKKAEAREEYQDRINSLENELSDIRSKLNELQKAKSGEQELIMSPEQKEAMERFRKKKVETRKKLKELRKELRDEIDSLKTGIKWANMGAVPFLVALSGVVLALIRRSRREREK